MNQTNETTKLIEDVSALLDKLGLKVVPVDDPVEFLQHLKVAAEALVGASDPNFHQQEKQLAPEVPVSMALTSPNPAAMALYDYYIRRPRLEAIAKRETADREARDMARERAKRLSMV